MPIAAVLGPRPLLEVWRKVSAGDEAAHGATFLAPPVSCAAALAVLEILRGERLIGRARRLGRLLSAELERLAARHPAIQETRGRGLFAALEFLGPQTSVRTARARARRVLEACYARGLLVLPAGLEGTALQLVPPLTIGESELALGARRLEAALHAALME